MDQLKSFKLSLIKKVLHCHDPQLLHTIDQILDMEGPSQSFQEEWLASDRHHGASELDEIQLSIETIFNGAPPTSPNSKTTEPT